MYNENSNHDIEFSLQYNLSAYHMEQTVKHLIFEQINRSNIAEKHNISVINTDIFTLLHICEYYKIELIIPDFIIERRQELADWGISTAYITDTLGLKETLNDYIKVIEEWIKSLTELYK